MPEILLDCLRGFFMHMRHTWLFYHALVPIFAGLASTLVLLLIFRPKPNGTLAIIFFSAVFLILALLSLVGVLPYGWTIPWNLGILCTLGMGIAATISLVDSFMKKRPVKVFAGPVVALLTSVFTYTFMVTILVANYGH